MAEEKKKKIKLEVPKANKVRIEEVLPEKSESVLDLGQWKDEIAALQGQQFNNMDEAIGAVVEAALQRMGPEVNQDQVREFVVSMFDSDPALKSELRAILKVS